MNCKQGDLAIIGQCLFRHDECHLGKIVKVVSPHHSLKNHWETEPKTFCSETGQRIVWDDVHLRPIRGDLLNDETTTSKELEAA